MTTILVIEDNPSLRRFTAEHLRRYFTEALVLEAGSADEAKSIAAVAAPSVAVVDNRLPDGEGRALCGELLEYDATTRCVLISGAFIEDPRELPGGHAICAILEKPFEPSQLLAAIVEALQARRNDTTGGVVPSSTALRRSTSGSWRRLTKRSSSHRLVNRLSLLVMGLRDFEDEILEAMKTGDDTAAEKVSQGVQEFVDLVQELSVSVRAIKDMG